MNLIYNTGPIFLSAAECNAQSRISLASLLTRLIVTATAHANEIGVGYADLIKDGNAWVLSRMSIAMDRYPGINETYSVETWVESFNRHLSNRNFTIFDGAGRPIGGARSLWACINIESRRPSSLTPPDVIIDHPCRIAPPQRQRPLTDPAEVHPYTFVFNDIDFNGHVNSARYVELITNTLGMDFMQSRFISRFDITYMREARYGQQVSVSLTDRTLPVVELEISRDGTPLTTARLETK